VSWSRPSRRSWKTRLEPHGLILEITESVVMENVFSAIGTLQEDLA
jgi:EAL domain-containing protein (putative c-di-GMP-specific phosphodiesterase class I)